MCFRYPEKLNKDSFRIFTLEPGEEKDDLQGSLKTHRLDAAPEYEAVSYEWGKRSETRAMKCNNHDFKITQSLDVTLRRLRSTDKLRFLWIDQICINQESNDERSAQVSIMRSIYSNATMVVAWLGPADTEAANSVKSLLVAMANVQQYSWLDHFPDDDRLVKMNLPRRDSRAWNDLNLMLSASYFSRIWILQELAISSKFQLLWGDIAISEDEYESLSYKIFFLALTEAEAVKGCPKIDWSPVFNNFLRTKKWEDEDLFQLVKWASGSQATIPQDEIYALIGLAGQHHYNVIPDYAKSESEAFADFTKRVISTNENLNILDHVYVVDPNEPKHLPLWAPRWQSGDEVVGFVNAKFKASRDTKAITKLSKNANILELRGLEVGLVVDVHPNRVRKLPQDVATALKIVKNHNIHFEHTYELDAIKVIILTMMVGRERDFVLVAGVQPPEDESYLDNFITHAAIVMVLTMQSTSYDNELFDLIQLALEVRGPLPQAEPRMGNTAEEQSILDQIRWRYPDNPEYISTAQDLIMLCKPQEKLQDCVSFQRSAAISQNLNFFITEKGYVGVGPRCMKAGDKVCVLFGGSTPYAIRPTSIEDEYLYLGPAYVHGIMDGEVIDAWEKDKDSESQEFQEKIFKLL